MRTALLVSLCLCALIGSGGCIPPADRRQRPDPDGPVVPVDNPLAKSIWDEIAKRVEAGHFKNSDELLGTVRELKTSGDLSDRDLRQFEAEFPELLEKRRDLSPDDARRLRSLAVLQRLSQTLVYV